MSSTEVVQSKICELGDSLREYARVVNEDDIRMHDSDSGRRVAFYRLEATSGKLISIDRLSSELFAVRSECSAVKQTEVDARIRYMTQFKGIQERERKTTSDLVYIDQECKRLSQKLNAEDTRLPLPSLLHVRETHNEEWFSLAGMRTGDQGDIS
jgi:hypothetical protein